MITEITESIGVFRPETAKAIYEDFKRRARQSNIGAENQMPMYRLPMYFQNDSGVEIPPYGILQVKSVFNDITTFHTVKRAFDYDACQTFTIINGPFAVPDGERGTAQDGPFYRVIHDNAISYSVGDRLGWKSGSFQVGLGSILVNLGADNAATNCIRVAFDYSTMTGVTTSTIPAGSSGTFQRRKKGSTTFTTDTSKTYTAWNDSTTDIANGARILAFPGEGVWLAVEVC